jgi:hypothetical protein
MRTFFGNPKNWISLPSLRRWWEVSLYPSYLGATLLLLCPVPAPPLSSSLRKKEKEKEKVRLKKVSIFVFASIFL